jgi:hypothetical protein
VLPTNPAAAVRGPKRAPETVPPQLAPAQRENH